MAFLVNAPQQHKQPSRKSKRAWRKNVDVSEIQAGLENARKELIEGYVVYMLRLCAETAERSVLGASLLKNLPMLFSLLTLQDPKRFKNRITKSTSRLRLMRFLPNALLFRLSKPENGQA